MTSRLLNHQEKIDPISSIPKAIQKVGFGNGKGKTGGVPVQPAFRPSAVKL